MPPTSPNSSPMAEKMKSDSRCGMMGLPFCGIRYPCPSPRPNSPPEASENSDWTI